MGTILQTKSPTGDKGTAPEIEILRKEKAPVPAVFEPVVFTYLN